jgi:hypothetical protein
MSTNVLPENVSQLVEWLMAQTPTPSEIWLIGSRANGRATEESDWDFLVFACSKYLCKLQEIGCPLSLVCDILVVVDGNRFESPFDKKNGSLDGWQWEIVDADHATYQGEKWEPDVELSNEYGGNSGKLEDRPEHAIRLWHTFASTD